MALTAIATIDPGQSPKARRQRVIGVLSVTQMIGWGTTLYLPSVMNAALQVDLGLSSETIFAGISIMLAVGAFAAPRIGAAHDAYGAWRIMAAGSALMAVALLMLAASGGIITYVCAWTLIGLAMPMSLATGAYTAITQIDALGARRIITIMTFFTGVTSTIFWPLTAMLEQRFGWRLTCLFFAASHVLVALPFHLWLLPRRDDGPARDQTAAAPLIVGTIPQPLIARSQRLLMIAFASQSFVAWGLSVHMIDLIKGLGLPAAVAVWVAAIKGPCQVSARVGEMLMASRHPATTTGLIAIGLQVAGLFPLLLGANSLVAAILFAVIFGISDGLMTLARPAIPLGLYGNIGYGAVVGRLSLPQNLVSAAAPIVFAAVISRMGLAPMVWVCLAGSAVALAAMLALLWMTRPAPRSTPAN